MRENKKRKYCPPFRDRRRFKAKELHLPLGCIPKAVHPTIMFLGGMRIAMPPQRKYDFGTVIYREKRKFKVTDQREVK